MPTNINRVVLTGNLTRDPELRSLPTSTAVCTLRIASNTRRKNSTTGEWHEVPNYFDVTVWGSQGENCARYLTKGSGVALDGRLERREWETEGSKRQAVQIVAEHIQFLAKATSSDPQDAPSDAGAPAAGVDQFEQLAGAPADDDIPF
ncbi:MAG: single-stranded DNA-binding protein [Solirubrobacteraceae bacterium]